MTQGQKNWNKTISNLKMVVRELPKLAEEKPKIRDEFNMNNYGIYSGYRIEDIKNNKCFTHGCLLGNIAILFEPKKEYLDCNNRFDYERFCKEEFPTLLNGGFEKISWSYLFHSNWSETNFKDFDSAIQRIKNFLYHGKLIKKFSFETMEITE